MSSSPGPGVASFACVAAAWQAHEAELRGYLRHRLAEPDAADDLLQDVFVKAMRSGEGFCSLDNPRAWLFQVARNAVVDRLRTTKPVEPLDESTLPTAAMAAEAPDPVDRLGTCVALALPELPPTDADVLRACDLQGLTQRAYAESRGLTLAATKARLLRARQRLRERITVACRVHFDPVDGRVSGHDGRA